MTAALRDICVLMRNGPGALALFGETLGRAGVSLEGGGVFAHDDFAIAHFLVRDADIAAAALTTAGLPVTAISDVVMLRLDQEEPGQLAAWPDSWLEPASTSTPSTPTTITTSSWLLLLMTYQQPRRSPPTGMPLRGVLGRSPDEAGFVRQHDGLHGVRPPGPEPVL